MARYSISTNGVTLSTSKDYKTIQTSTSGAGSMCLVTEVAVLGEATSSTVVRTIVNRPTANAATIGANTQTPEKFNPGSPAAGATIAGTATAVTSWTTDATLSAGDIVSITFNAFGGIFRWVAPPDYEVVVCPVGTATAGQLSFRSRTGTPVVSGHIIYEEK
jgi:hypothetical protein